MDTKLESGNAPRFAVDEMMGKLARWMRLMGLDVEHRRPFPDNELMEIARREGRVLITRDRKLARNKPPPEVWLIEEDLAFHQLVEVVRHARIDPMEKAFTRCGVCNTPLVDISKEEAAGRVPPFVYATQTDYRLCQRCERIYWPGSHRERMEKLFGEVAKTAIEKQ